MKRIIALLTCLALLSGLAGCSGRKYQSPGTFYYRSAEISYGSADAVIAPETRELAGMEDDLKRLLDSYFAGPETSSLESPFPRDTRVIQWELVESALDLQLSEEFAALSGIDLTIACACITRTFIQFSSIRQVRIHCGGTKLGGEDAVTMSEQDLMLFDNSLERLSVIMTVYYTDSGKRYLIGQEVSVNLAADDDVISYLFGLLAEAPKDSGLVSALPEDTQLLSAAVTDGLCSVDLSSEFESEGPSSSREQYLSLMCIVNTLTQLEEIDRVEFSTEGSLLTQYRSLSIPDPLTRDDRIIGPVRTAVNEFDATLYLANGTAASLVGIPTRIRQTAALSQAELVVETLLRYESHNALRATIPQGTELRALTVEGGVCRIDLSDDFLDDADGLSQAVRSIVASVCALEGIESVLITVEGSRLAEYPDPISPSEAWLR